MDMPSFLLSLYKENVALVSSIAWPIAVVTSVWLFRREVRGLLDRVVSVNWREGILQLRDAVREAQADIEEVEAEKLQEVPKEAEPAGRQTADSVNRLDVYEAPPSLSGHGRTDYELGEPESAVRRKNRYLSIVQGTGPSYLRIARFVKQLSKDHSTGVGERAQVEDHVDALAEQGVIPESVARAIIELRAQRKMLFSRRFGEISPSELQAFNRLADQVFELLQRAAYFSAQRPNADAGAKEAG